MSNVTATPALADISSLGKQIELDRSASVHELRQRDHAIGLQCDASDDASRLLFWLKSMPDCVNPEKETQAGWFSEDSAATFMRFLAVVLGFMGMAGFLLASEKRLVNVLVFLFVFVLIARCFQAFLPSTAHLHLVHISRLLLPKRYSGAHPSQSQYTPH